MNTNAVPCLGVPGQFNKVILMCQCCLFAGLTLTAIVILGQKTEPKSPWLSSTKIDHEG